MAILLARGQITIVAIKDGAPGADGKDGLDALEVTIKNAPLVFDTEDNGVVNSSAIQAAEIWLTRDGKNVIDDIKQSSITDSLNFKVESNNAVIRKTSECLQIVLKGIGVAKENVNGNDVSKTSGYVVVSFNDGAKMFSRQIAFSVNVSKFNSSVIQTAKLYERKYTEVSNKYDALPEEIRDKASFTEYNSAIKQSAREISLSLTEQAVSRRNLLVNSDFARNGGFYISFAAKATMERLSGYKNSNCFHFMPTSTLIAINPMLRWEGTNDTYNNIPIVAGKKYTISCWAKVSDTTAKLYIKVFGQTAITGNIESSTTAAGTLLDEPVTLNSANTWQLVSFTFVASGGYSYCSVRLFYSLKTNGRIDGYVCRPMLEQSDSYNGWTLSDEDYDYRGGNMLDNTRYLNVGGNLKAVGDVATNAKDGCSMSVVKVEPNNSKTLLRFENLPVTINNNYTLSFLVKSADTTSKKNVICSLNLLSNVKFAECSNRRVSSYTSSNNNDTTSGYVEIENIPTEWTRVWYHFSAKAGTQKQVIAIQAYVVSGTGKLQICQPKLEEGVNNTPWTEATEDIANKAALKRTGIDIEKGKITLDAENTIITGDLHLKGVLIENSAEITYDPQQPIICDMVHHKSVSLRTWHVVSNHPEFLNGVNINPYVVLPMINDVILSKTDAHGELTVHGIKESGMKLTISSQYNPLVAKWATGKKYQYNDRYSMESQEGKPYEFLHRAVVVVFADPRLTSVNNYNDSNTGRIHPQGGGVPPFFGDAKYDGGCFICNGRRSRMLFLMPGQSLHLTSSIERIGNSDVVVWYIDNSNDFTPISKTVTIIAQSVNGSDGYDWGGKNEDKSFPDDRLNGSVGYRYEDVLLAPPQLSATYPERLTSEALGTNSVSKVPFVFNVY